MSRLRWNTLTEIVEKLDELAQQSTPDRKRNFLDKVGDHFTAGKSNSMVDRFVDYGVRRHESVARLCALFELARDYKRPGTGNQITVTTSRVYWQSFGGNPSMHACHTCPTHLNFNHQMPTLITDSMPLKRHLIFEFADCMLMPVAINAVDSIVDSSFGRKIFAETASLILNQRGATWNDGLAYFKRECRVRLPGAFEAITTPTNHFKLKDAKKQTRLEMILAYYEGLFMRSTYGLGARSFQQRVKNEIEDDLSNQRGASGRRPTRSAASPP